MAVTEKVILASGDGHVGPQTKDYRPYVDPEFREDFDAYLAKHQWMWSPAEPTSMLPAKCHDKLRIDESFIPGVGSPVAWDPNLRLRAYDEEGIVAEVLVPDDQNRNDPPWGSGLATSAVARSKGENYSPEWQRRGARAYNRWLADFCSTDPRRLLGCIILGTLEDVDWAIEEVRRCYEGGLRTAVMLPLDYYLPLYHHPRYDPFWRVCEELDLTINIHLSKGGPDWVGNSLNTISLLWFTEAMWFAQRPLWCAMFGGVFDRFPKLRFVFSEIGADWVSPLLRDLDGLVTNPDELFTRFPNESAPELIPSEYWARNCFLCHSATNFVLRDGLESGLLDRVPNVIWGADIGHGEGFWPQGREVLRPVIERLPAPKLRRFLGEDLPRAYPAASNLRDIVDRIGPTVDELGLAA